MSKIYLVYQVGLANVFKDGRERLYQGSYEDCLTFASGCAAMGASVRTFHCERAGDIAINLPPFEWQPGKGDLWADKRVDLTIGDWHE
jgi:hypothetical protein